MVVSKPRQLDLARISVGTYYKVGKYVRFRPADLESLDDAGRVQAVTSPSHSQHRTVHQGVAALKTAQQKGPPDQD